MRACSWILDQPPITKNQSWLNNRRRLCRKEKEKKVYLFMKLKLKLSDYALKSGASSISRDKIRNEDLRRRTVESLVLLILIITCLHSSATVTGFACNSPPFLSIFKTVLHQLLVLKQPSSSCNHRFLGLPFIVLQSTLHSCKIFFIRHSSDLTQP